MPRLLSNVSGEKTKTNFGNTLAEINYIRNVLFEIGPNPTDVEIDRAITLAKVDMHQDKMNGQMVSVKGPMDKYVVKVKQENQNKK